ncbi:MAG: 1-acyl-sn-glycerol-3-phosphate acyltransferase [Kiritimatiellae bacterium]|nr:1-acyl-sn-glycerol-3-phosphate acyltransferase [Kiritimatiellia bacterium]
MSGHGASRSTFFYAIVTWGLRVLLRLLFHVRTKGVRRFPQHGAFIVAGNHASFLDPPVMGAMIKGWMIHFMARDSLFHPPWFGGALRRLGVIPLDRARGDIGAMRKALQTLKEGKALGLFPEGTRSPDGNLQPAKGGIGFLVAKAAVPVFPAYIHGTFEAWPKGSKMKRGTRVTVVYGDPISPEEVVALGKGEYEKIAALIMERIAALRPEAIALLDKRHRPS